MPRKIIIATCQHSINADINKNLKVIINQIIQAKQQQADIVHFAECSLSGYGGIDFVDYEEQDQDLLKAAITEITAIAKKYQITVLLGSHFFIKDQRKPFNSLFLISSEGKILHRYDKRLLFEMDEGKEEKYYLLGKTAVIFQLNGIRCGLLICHEWRYTELYREYKSMGVELVFQSFYDRVLNIEEYQKSGIDQEKLLTGTMMGNAANNHLWISASNTSKKESCLPSMVIQPDGRLKSKLKRNRTGVLITEIDMDQKFDDPSKYWRDKFLK